MKNNILISRELNNRTEFLRLLKREETQKAKELFDERFNDFKCFVSSKYGNSIYKSDMVAENIRSAIRYINM